MGKEYRIRKNGHEMLVEVDDRNRVTRHLDCEEDVPGAWGVMWDDIHYGVDFREFLGDAEILDEAFSDDVEEVDAEDYLTMAECEEEIRKLDEQNAEFERKTEESASKMELIYRVYSEVLEVPTTSGKEWTTEEIIDAYNKQTSHCSNDLYHSTDFNAVSKRFEEEKKQVLTDVIKNAKGELVLCSVVLRLDEEWWNLYEGDGSLNDLEASTTHYYYAEPWKL